MKQNKFFILIKESGVFLSFFTYIYILVLPLVALGQAWIEQHSWLMILFLFIGNVFYMGFLIYYFRKDLVDEWRSFRANYGKMIDISITWWFIGVTGMALSNYLISTFIPAATPTNQELIEANIFRFPLYMAFMTIIFAPLVEELIFRKLLRKMFRTTWLFIAVSTFTFGICHVVTVANNWQDFVLVIPYAILGFTFAVTYVKTKSIYAPIFTHAFHNGLLFAIIYIRYLI